MKLKFVFATLIMTVLLAMTTFAGWTNEEKGWRYYDNNGCEVVLEWKKGADDNWYYLDAQGYLATDTLIQNDDNTFSFVDEMGARVANMWICRTDSELGFDNNWLYIKANGKSVENGWYTVNEKRYHFTDNKMDYGFYGGSDNEDWRGAEYYLGGADEGWTHTGWVKVYDEDGNLCWLYFAPKKAHDKTMIINDNKYCFNEDGVMISGTTATSSDATKYFNNDGALVRDSWIKRTNDEGEVYWQYAKMSGELIDAGEHKINGKYYFFEDKVMKTGWQANKYYGADGARVSGKKTIDEKDYWFESNGKARYGVWKGYYFGETDETSEAEKCYLRTSEDFQYRIEAGKLIRFDGKVCTSHQKYYDSWNDQYYIIDANDVPHKCNKDGKY